MIGGLAATRTCALGILLVGAGCVSKRGGSDLKKFGLEYRLQELGVPRLNRVHLLRVDLADRKTTTAVVVAADPDGAGPADAVLTDPFKLACDPEVIAFINTNPWESLPDRAGKKNRNWFEGQPVDIQGLAASGCRVRSPARPGGASVWVDEQGRVFLGDVQRDGHVAEGTAGFQRVVGDGAVVVPPGGRLHPRTAMGVDRAGCVLWLVVVDGRQEGYSEGMTLHELGCVMRGLGCWTATNMDGGGSSVMGVALGGGPLRVVNSPSDRRSGAPSVRPVPVVLTIRRPSVSGERTTKGETTVLR